MSGEVDEVVWISVGDPLLHLLVADYHVGEVGAAHLPDGARQFFGGELLTACCASKGAASSRAIRAWVAKNECWDIFVCGEGGGAETGDWCCDGSH